MRPLERVFYKYGYLIATHPWPFIIIPTLLTIISTYGFLYFHSQDDIWDIYAPTNGLSRVEEKALQRFEYASASHHHRMQILISRKDGGSLLFMKYLDEIDHTHHLITENVTASNGNSTFRYDEMCGVYCADSNAGVIAFLKATIETNSSQLIFTFPKASAFNNEAFLGYSIGNLTKDSMGIVREARMIILHYMVDTSLLNGKELARNFEFQLRKIFEILTRESRHLDYALLSRTRELEEQRAISLTAIPYLFITSIVLLGFMLITLVSFPLYKSQHIEAIIAIISPTMALWTTVGFLWWCGFPFSNILTVVPFLVITIGIDDAFLILAGWRQSTVGASLEQRMAESVAISGASVSVTSVTDVLCFAIGLFSNMPVVQLFCLYVTIALAMDFVYQLTFFTALMSFVVRRQITIDEKQQASGQSSETSSMQKWQEKLRDGSILSMETKKKKTSKSRDWLEIFVDWLHSGFAKVLVMTIFGAHIGLSCYLATKVNTDFDMENLYLADSPLTDISRKMQNFVLKESFIDNFAVYPMPDFANETTRNRFEKMVERLEMIPKYGGGLDNTNLWLRKYKETVSFWGEDDEAWNAETLLNNYRENDFDEKYITTSKNPQGIEVIDGFFFTIVYQNMSSFLEVETLMEIRRKIISEYPEFTVHAHHPFEKVPTESAAAAPTNFIQTSVSAIILMSLLVLIFVMKFEAIISVVISIISICIGIIGYLHLWDVHLDAVSLISILMSIGFSVDYSAHVCYHYFAHAAEEEKQKENTHRLTVNGTKEDRVQVEKFVDTRQRVVSTLRGVGWPVIQSGLSTAMGMFPLLFVHAYVVAVFWKTILLVSILGMFHALLLLPIIFILTADIKRVFSCSKSKNKTNKVQTIHPNFINTVS
ncbi:unnamed protein product, partial [Mesorhabditis belari]|uniref:SSD domain-containing protein n=1 Tax=Mesorhabditis belari TaxID=2138241 RepID=A0AAF3EX19_9BILA